MTYTTIQPPFTLEFSEMSKMELRNYFAWFHDIMPQRLDGLCRAVHAVPGYESWQADFTPASLDPLGKWFAAQVETRPRTREEMQEIQSRSTFPIEISSEELTNRTFSIAMDIGMYFSQVFLKNHPDLRWDQPFSGKRDIDYGQPVLVTFGPAPFNPVRMMVTRAYSLVNQPKIGKSLHDLYDIWARIIK